jgi:hypothetical protein
MRLVHQHERDDDADQQYRHVPRLGRLRVLEHIAVVRVRVWVAVLVFTVAVVALEPPVQVGPDFLETGVHHPSPGGPEIIPVPERQVCQGGSHAQVRCQELDGPGSGIPGQAVLDQQCRVSISKLKFKTWSYLVPFLWESNCDRKGKFLGLPNVL